MNTSRYALLLIILVSLSALGFTASGGDQVILAKYGEDVKFDDAFFFANANPLVARAGADSDTVGLRVAKQVLGIPVLTSTYMILAADMRGNFAGHEAFVRVDNTLGIAPELTTLVSPSPRFPLIVKTNEPATCSWDFIGLGQENLSLMKASTDGMLHNVPEFEETYRFFENELVPIRIVCTTPDAGEYTRNMLVGWSNQELSFSTSLWPRTLSDPDMSPEITVLSDAPSECTLSSTLLPNPITSSYARRHIFSALPPGSQGTKYVVSCVNARGEELPQQELSIVQNFVPSAIDIRVFDGIVNNRSVLVQAQTSLPATCSQTLGSPSNLGPLLSGRDHQRQVNLTEGLHVGRVSCVGAENIQGGTPAAYTVDTSAPRVRFVSAPEVCGDVLLLTLHGADNPSSVLIRSANDEILREWQGTDELLIQQGGLGVQEGASVTVLGIDEAGNVGPLDTKVAVNASNQETCSNRGIDQKLTLLSPPSGATDEDNFSVIVGSELVSNCTWSVGAEAKSMLGEDSLVHTITRFAANASMERNSEKTLTVSCIDRVGQKKQEAFVISWDLTDPHISLNATPLTVTSLATPFSNITVTADQEVKCSFDNGGYDAEFSQNQSFEAVIGYGEENRTVDVICKNRAGKTALANITFFEKYPSTMQIVVTAPPAVLRTESFTLKAQTSMYAACTAIVNATPFALSSENAIAHEKEMSLSEGVHTILVNCSEQDDVYSTAQVSHQVTIDKTAPTIQLSAKALTCGLSSYAVTGNATDNVAVEKIIISFNGKNYTASSLPYNIEGLNLTAGQTYKLSATPYDSVGNVGSSVSQDVQAATKETGACDKENPVGKLVEKIENNRTTVWVTCKDDIACDDAYEFGTGPEKGECKLASKSFKANTTIVLTSTQKVCWRVKDLVGNVDSGEEIVGVLVRPDYCFDKKKSGDETDVDCGGKCVACPDKKPLACSSDSDCPSDDFCYENFCTEKVACTTSAQCETGEACVQGQCMEQQDRPPVCSSSSQCADGVCYQSACYTPVPKSCLRDSQCGAERVCYDGYCRTPSGEDLVCSMQSDCSSGSCVSNVCQTSADACKNGKKDGTETDVDCGGLICGACSDTKKCEVRFDCLSKSCIGGVCKAPTCDDGIKNGVETDVDCGGSSCQKCVNGNDCVSDVDCTSGICSYGTCSATRLDKEEPGSFDETLVPAAKKSSTLAFVFILLGVVLMGGGGGYMWYEKTQSKLASSLNRPKTEFERPTFDGMQKQQTVTPAIRDDFSASKLRDEAREERRNKRIGARKELLGAFESPAKEKHSDIGPETVHKQLQKAGTPQAIKDLAKSLADKGTDKHELSSALTDLHAGGDIDKKALDELRESLDL